MPIIKSVKKRMKQNAVRKERRYPLRSKLKTVFKNVLTLIKDGKAEEATKMMPHAFSVIDMACKKNIIHKNNAARKKSRLARELNVLTEKSTNNTVKAEDKK